MPKPLPSPPALDLASLSIHDLWCLSDLFEHLAHEASSFLNQPRVDGPVAAYASAFWDKFCHGTNARIIEEIKRRTPSTSSEAEWKAEAVIRYLSQGDSFHDILAAVTDVLKTREDRAVAL